MNVDSVAEAHRTTLRTLARGIQFLEYVARCPSPPRLKDISKALNINITTCYHLSNTLQELGYLTKMHEGELRISGRVGLLYEGMLRHFDLARETRSIVEGLSRRTKETAYLCSASLEGVVVQTLTEGTQPVQVAGLYVGYYGLEHARASGKAVLAYLEPEDRLRLIERSMKTNAPETATEILAQIEDELAVVQARGWSLDDRQFQESVCCVAAPFFRHDGRVAGSIAVSIPAARFANIEKTVVKEVCAAAEEVSALVGLSLTAM
jgi:IclR family transcriptional regulator, acetate operon repressor